MATMGSRSVEHVQRQVWLGDELYPQVTVTIRRNPRARHVRLHVDDTGEITVSAPRRLALYRIDEVVRERAEWLRDALMRAEQLSRVASVDLHAGDPVRYLGAWLPVRALPSARYGRVRLDAGRIELTYGPAQDPYDLLAAFYRKQARSVITARVEEYAPQFGLRVASISIRDQKTRWGSCSADGRLSFNWRLVMAPLWVVDAIVMHELCHIDRLDHSRAFWRLLDSRYPRHREAQRWLREHGGTLRLARSFSANPPSAQSAVLGPAAVSAASGPPAGSAASGAPAQSAASGPAGTPSSPVETEVSSPSTAPGASPPRRTSALTLF